MVLFLLLVVLLCHLLPTFLARSQRLRTFLTPRPVVLQAPKLFPSPQPGYYGFVSPDPFRSSPNPESSPRSPSLALRAAEDISSATLGLSVSLKTSQRPIGSCTSLCRSDCGESWNLRVQDVGVGGALSLQQSVSGPPHGALPPQITLAAAAAAAAASPSASTHLTLLLSARVSNASLVCSPVLRPQPPVCVLQSLSICMSGIILGP